MSPREEVLNRGARVLTVLSLIVNSSLLALRAEAANLIHNPGFEEDFPGNAFYIYDIKDGSWSVDGTVAHSGKRSLRFEKKTEAGEVTLDVVGKDWKRMPVEYHHKYVLTAWYKLEAKPSPKLGVSGTFTYFDKEGKPITSVGWATSTNLSQWTQLKAEFYPVKDCSTAQVRIWFVGQGTLWLDDLSLEETSEPELKSRYRYDRLLSESDKWVIWKEQPLAKIPKTGVPPGLRRGKIELTCARNETEPFQLVITPKRDTANVHLEFSDLRGAKGVILREAISYQPVGFIEIKESDDPGLVGWHSDPLLPDQAVHLKEGENQPFWVKVRVPEGAAPGRYQGQIEIRTTGEACALPLALEVRSFRIPTIPWLEAGFLFYGQPFVPYDKRPFEQIVADLRAAMKEARIAANPADRPAVELEIRGGTLTITDFSKFDREVESQIKQGVRKVALWDLSGFGYSDGWSPYPMNKFGIDSRKPDIPRFCALLTQYCQQMGRHLEEKGWHDTCFILPYDEPPPPLAGDVFRVLQAIRTGDPRLQITIICDLNPELAAFATTCHLHMAPGSVHLDWVRDWKSKGKRIGYSCWEQPLSRYRYVMNRIAPWLTYWDYGDMTGYYCGALTMPGNPWSEMEKCLTILYPPLPGGQHLVRSVRYELVREAIEDFDYFKILESRNRELKERLNWPNYDEVERVRELLAEIVTGETATDFVPDPGLLYHLRDKIADEIETSDKPPLIQVRTEPGDNSSSELSLIKLFGAVEKGSQVRIRGKRVVLDHQGRFAASVELTKEGENVIPIEVSRSGQRKLILRRFVLKADPDLKKLAAALDVGRKIGATVAPFDRVYRQLSEPTQYSAGDKELLHRTILDAQKNNIAFLRAKVRQGTIRNRVYQALLERAELLQARGHLDKAERYLLQLAGLSADQDPSLGECQIAPTIVRNHFGFILKNAFVETIVLEAGFRILDFRVRGVPCLKASDLDKDLAEDIRVDRAKVGQCFEKGNVPQLNGYADGGVASFMDWDLSFEKLSSKEIVVSGEVLLPKGMFLLKRTITLRASKPALELRYLIRNVFPASRRIASEDPNLYNFTWTGRCVPAIGGEPEGDILVVPASEKLPQSEFNHRMRNFYYLPAISLTDRFVGSFDPHERTGLVQLLDQQIKDVYVWFHIGPSPAFGTDYCYTLEPQKGIRTKPFFIPPGESLSFTNYLVGVTEVTTEEEFVRKAKESLNGR